MRPLASTARHGTCEAIGLVATTGVARLYASVFWRWNNRVT